MEWRDNYFPWLDQYKPKQSEINVIYIEQPEDSTQTATVTLRPPCGWLGKCFSQECNFYKTKLPDIDEVYLGQEHYFVLYVLKEECY